MLAKKLNQEKINPFKDIQGIINNPVVPYFGLKNIPLCLIITCSNPLYQRYLCLAKSKRNIGASVYPIDLGSYYILYPALNIFKVKSASSANVSPV